MNDSIPSGSGSKSLNDKDTNAPSLARKPAQPRTPPSLVYTSYNNLVSLANAQEGLMESGKKLVWRDPGEPPATLETLEECLLYALRGGFREFELLRTHRWLALTTLTPPPPLKVPPG